MKATWNGAVLADSDDTVVVEGNHYFPPSSVNWDLLNATETHTVCPWKGTASYWTVTVEGQTNPGGKNQAQVLGSFDEAAGKLAALPAFTVPELAQQVYGVQVKSVTGTSAVIQWSTTRPSTSFVEYGPTPALGERVEDMIFSRT